MENQTKNSVTMYWYFVTRIIKIWSTILGTKFEFRCKFNCDNHLFVLKLFWNKKFTASLLFVLKYDKLGVKY